MIVSPQPRVAIACNMFSGVCFVRNRTLPSTKTVLTPLGCVLVNGVSFVKNEPV